MLQFIQLVRHHRISPIQIQAFAQTFYRLFFARTSRPWIICYVSAIAHFQSGPLMNDYKTVGQQLIFEFDAFANDDRAAGEKGYCLNILPFTDINILNRSGLFLSVARLEQLPSKQHCLF